MIRCAVFVCPCRLPLIARASARRQRFLSAGISAMSKQEEAAEIIREAVNAKIGKSGAKLEGTPEEVAERLVKEEGGEELKHRELRKKGAHQIPGVAGSGIERGEAAAVAQSAVDRASQPKEGRTVMPEAAERAKDMLAEEIRNASN